MSHNCFLNIDHKTFATASSDFYFERKLLASNTINRHRGVWHKKECKVAKLAAFWISNRWGKKCKQSSKYQKGSVRWNECAAAVTRYLSKGGRHFIRREQANSRKWFKHRIVSTSCLVGTTLSRRPWPTCRTKLHRWEDPWCRDPLANDVLYTWSSVDIKRVDILLQRAAGNYWKSTHDLLLVYNAFICLFC